MNNTAETREREIPHQMSDIQDVLERLDNASSVLRDKLIPILKDDLVSSKDTETDASAEKSLVPLASELKLIRRHVNKILSTIMYLTEACEL